MSTILDHISPNLEFVRQCKESSRKLVTLAARKNSTESVMDPQTIGLNLGVKRMEVGFLNTRKPMTVYLYSERFPIWLFSLEASWVHHLFIVGYTSLPAFMLLFTTGERDILERLLDPFILRNLVSFIELERFQPALSATTLVLMSGNLYSFMVPNLDQYQVYRIIGIVDSHCPGRLRNGKPTSQDGEV